MSDNEFSKENEPITNTETELENISNDIQEEVAEETAETQESTEETSSIEAGEVPSAPEKMKVGEKEYDQKEIEELVKTQEEQKAESEKNQYQPREIALIEADLDRENANLGAEVVSLQKKFVSLANDPTVLNEAGEQIPAGYTAEEAYTHGLQTGQWEYFINCLNPQDAVAFQNDRLKLAQTYNEKLGYLNQEKEYIAFQEKKKEDLSKWDSFIEENLKDSKGANHLLNKVKQNFSFDEKGIKDFLQWFEEAKALDNNEQHQELINDSAKQASINSTVTGQKPQGNDNAIPKTTDEIIAKMEKNPEWYNKNVEKIQEMYDKGLIKE